MTPYKRHILRMIGMLFLGACIYAFIDWWLDHRAWTGLTCVPPTLYPAMWSWLAAVLLILASGIRR